MNGSIVRLKEPIGFVSYSAIGGFEEKRGPLGEKFDLCDPTDRFSKKTWEEAEAEMSRLALNTALAKASVSHERLGLLVAGDLQNQCVASSGGLSSFGIPYIGVYGACSTCTESLIVLSSLMSVSEVGLGACVTSSHNASAERQFRSPVEYGGVRSATAQWTSTAAGAFILGKKEVKVQIKEYMIGRMVDGATKDGSNMGGAMAFSAADTLIRYFENSDSRPEDFDYIVTGDLGRVGSAVFNDIIKDTLPGAAQRHVDCGNLLYDPAAQDAHSGASGCGTSASVLATYFLPSLESGKIKNILFMSTGALMSKDSLLHGENIYGITPLIKISLSDS